MIDIAEILQLIGPALLETIFMASVSTLLAYVIGLPLGIILVVTSPNHILPCPILRRWLGLVINVLRSAPFVILMVALLPFTRWLLGTSIGPTAATVPLIISAAPFVARVVESALNEIPYGVVEAAIVMGATPWQIITQVLLPEAKPALISGAAICSINIIGYTAMAGAVGGGGLGDLAIQYGYNRFRTDIMLITLGILIIIVQLLQQTGNCLASKADHR